jgi:hypothetical protein
MGRRVWSWAFVWLLAAAIVAPGTAGDTNPRPSPARPQPVVVKVETGFDWVDAGLGAAAALAAVLVVAGVTLVVRTGGGHIERNEQ